MKCPKLHSLDYSKTQVCFYYTDIVCLPFTENRGHFGVVFFFFWGGACGSVSQSIVTHLHKAVALLINCANQSGYFLVQRENKQRLTRTVIFLCPPKAVMFGRTDGKLLNI